MREASYTTHGPEETEALAASLVAELPPRSQLALIGDLGSGKTCFVRGLARALGITQPVTSPTFTIINEYAGRVPLYHIDLYRIGGPDEALALGLEDYFERGVTAIEWPEKAGDLLSPDTTIRVELAVGDQDDERFVRVTWPG